MKLLFTLCTSLILSSCVYHHGILSNASMSSSGNTEYVDIAIGYNKVGYFAGMGGRKQDAFLNEAKRSLMANYELGPNQSFENISVDVKTTFFGVFQRVEVIAIADVVQKETNGTITYSDNYKQLLITRNPKTKAHLKLNEKALVISGDLTIKNYLVVGFYKDKAVLFDYAENGTINITKKKVNELYTFQPTEELTKAVGFTVGDSVSREFQQSYTSGTTLEGQVIAMNKRMSLVDFGGEKIMYNSKNLYKMKN
ncbi:MAG: hypothetical protein FGM14_03590 [Flavobacteriales bacterium]|nr:hypothetical protein [Flavobacteriales bacterium]